MMNADYQIGPHGYGDSRAGCPDRAPYAVAYDRLGIRYNCQGLDPTLQVTNLQTMRAITEDPGGPGLPDETLRSSRDGSPIRSERPTVEALRRLPDTQRRTPDDPR